MTRVALIGVLLAGCSDDGGGAQPCDLAHRNGTFVAHAEERAGGDCGSLPDEVVRVNDPGGLGPGCVKDLPDDASPDRCRYDRSYTCTADDGSQASFDVTTSETDGGDRFSGVLAVTLLDPNGDYVCASAYNVTYTRQ